MTNVTFAFSVVKLWDCRANRSEQFVRKRGKVSHHRISGFLPEVLALQLLAGQEQKLEHERVQNHHQWQQEQ